MIPRGLSFCALLALLLAKLTETNGYSIDSTSTLSLTLEDVQTGSSPISTLFMNENATVIVDGISWTGDAEGGSVLHFQTLVNGEKLTMGSIKLPEDPLTFPTRIHAGEIFASKRGSTVIEVLLSIDDSEASASLEVQSIMQWAATVPMIVALILSFASFRVEISLLAGLFVGACMVAGSLSDGFKSIITTYILDAASESSHVYM
jgi:hypothetical protein